MSGSFCTVCRRRIPQGPRCSRHALKSPSNRAWREAGAAGVRQQVLDRDGACVDCGSTEDLEVDHLIPVSQGGKTEPENQATRCADCHRRRHKLAWMSPT